MTETPLFTRRLFLAGTSAAALLPGAALAQSSAPTSVEFAAACRALSGFDAIPEALVAGAAKVFADADRTALIEGNASDEMKKNLLKTLYTGMHAPEEGEPERFAYPEALMYACVEDSLNVPSFCGGLPGYWAEKPADA